MREALVHVPKRSRERKQKTAGLEPAACRKPKRFTCRQPLLHAPPNGLCSVKRYSCEPRLSARSCPKPKSLPEFAIRRGLVALVHDAVQFAQCSAQAGLAGAVDCGAFYRLPGALKRRKMISHTFQSSSDERNVRPEPASNNPLPQFRHVAESRLYGKCRPGCNRGRRQATLIDLPAAGCPTSRPSFGLTWVLPRLAPDGAEPGARQLTHYQ